jgi:exodeoxyribonuclease V gamma subunit
MLAMTATEPQLWEAIAVGRSGYNGGSSTFGPVPPEFATLVLADLVDLYRTGLSAPLPMPPRAASEYAERRRDDRAPNVIMPRIQRTWELECDACYRAVFGGELDQLLASPSVAAEERGSLAEPTRFGTLARRVWHPLLMSEVRN